MCYLVNYSHYGGIDMLTNRPTLMTANYRTAIYARYNVLDHCKFQQFDSNWLWLENRLKNIKKNIHDPLDRYVIEHQDTDYYLADEFLYGIGLYNLINIFKNLDIPLFTLLLYTNHFGISREINKLATDPNDRPTVIETFITNTHYTNDYCDLKIDSYCIEFPAICLMGGTKRVHRIAMFRFLEQQQLLDIVPTSI